MRRLFDEADEGAILRVHLQPGAGRDAVVGVHGDALKVRVVAPPVSGRANEGLLDLLAQELGVQRTALEITSGATARAKRVRVSGMEGRELEKRLERLVAEVETAGRGPAARTRR
jgi:uncharacterized protein (TIGR00251 family)